jgi:hypothetical protein
MKKRFIESSRFTAWIIKHLKDEEYVALQQLLLEDSDAGVVIKGCGGLRKLRLADPKRKKGTRGGARVIYLHIPEVDWIYLIAAYSKDEQEDLSADQKKVLKRLAETLREEAIRSNKGMAGEDK